MSKGELVFELSLEDRKSSCEFSYLDLVKKRLGSDPNKKNDAKAIPNSENPFADKDSKIDQQMEDYVRSLEKKYGTMITVKKAGKQSLVRIDDYADPGDGYDSEDSFIDDTEANEILVAPTVTTRFGGFFVHEGVLEDLEETGAEFEGSVPRKTTFDDKHKIQKNFNKRNKSKELVERAMKCLSSTKKKTPSIPRTPSTPSNLAHPQPAQNGSAAKPAQPSSTPQTPTKPSANEVSTDAPIGKPPNDENVPRQAATLPSGLPKEIEQQVARLGDLAKKSNADMRKRMLGADFDRELLALDRALHTHPSVSRAQRTGVILYMADFVNLKKNALAKRIRKEKERVETQDVDAILSSLSEAIKSIMPSMIAAHETEFSGHQERLKQWHNEAARIDELNARATCEAQLVKKPTRPFGPRKKFRWSESTRVPFEKIIEFQISQYKSNPPVGVSLEDYLKKYLLDTLIPLWPEGWITIAALWRNAQPLYQKYMVENGLMTAKSSEVTPASAVSNGGGASSATAVISGSASGTPKAASQPATPATVQKTPVRSCDFSLNRVMMNGSASASPSSSALPVAATVSPPKRAPSNSSTDLEIISVTPAKVQRQSVPPPPAPPAAPSLSPQSSSRPVTYASSMNSMFQSSQPKSRTSCPPSSRPVVSSSPMLHNARSSSLTASSRGNTVTTMSTASASNNYQPRVSAQPSSSGYRISSSASVARGLDQASRSQPLPHSHSQPSMQTQLKVNNRSPQAQPHHTQQAQQQQQQQQQQFMMQNSLNDRQMEQLWQLAQLNDNLYQQVTRVSPVKNQSQQHQSPRSSAPAIVSYSSTGSRVTENAVNLMDPLEQQLHYQNMLLAQQKNRTPSAQPSKPSSGNGYLWFDGQGHGGRG